MRSRSSATSLDKASMRPLSSRRNSRTSFRSQAKSATSRAGVSHGAITSIANSLARGRVCCFRFSPCAKSDAESTESQLRAGRWPNGKKPLLNPS